MAHLKVIQGGEPGRQYELLGQRSVVGRSPDCEVVLDVAAVSRRHAVITHDGKMFHLQDMGKSQRYVC